MAPDAYRSVLQVHCFGQEVNSNSSLHGASRNTKCAVWVLPFCPPRTQFWKRSQSQLWASEQTDRQTPQMYTHCVIQSRPQTHSKNWFFLQIGSGHEIMYDTLYASRKHLYNSFVHKQSQNGPYIGRQQSTNLVGIVKAVIHKSCNEWSFTNCGGKGRRKVSYINKYSHYNTYLRKWRASASILIKAHLMAFHTSGMKCYFIKKKIQFLIK